MGADHELYLAGLALACLFIPWLVTGPLAALRRSSRRTATGDLTPFEGRLFVIDGDTIIVRRTRVRMFGMDAPELTQRGGYKARSHLIRLAGGQRVGVVPVCIDRYGRTVAKVWRGETDLSDRMVRDGYARATSKWNSDYEAAEFQARRERRGLWSRDPVGGIRDPAAHRRRMAR